MTGTFLKDLTPEQLARLTTEERGFLLRLSDKINGNDEETRQRAMAEDFIKRRCEAIAAENKAQEDNKAWLESQFI